MGQPGSTTASQLADGDSIADRAWEIVFEAACRADALSQLNATAAFALAPAGDGRRQHLLPVPQSHRETALLWNPETGWELRLAPTHPLYPHIDLYLPICSATSARPMTIGHMGQSLDGFIATLSGDSQYVTGPENILHLHRMRALCDAIVVGAGTVAADDPLLTTRHVSGPSPVRVVLDPTRRLGEHYKVFSDNAVETLYVCGRSMVRDGETKFGAATIVPVDESADGIDVTAVLVLLRARRCHRIFVEGGGVTVSLFLQADLLDRLQVAVAPFIIGDGRPAIRLPAPAVLSQCARPQYRVFKMGGDVFFDCDLRHQLKPSATAGDADAARTIGTPTIARVI